MPRIFDNIEQQLLPALRDTLESATRADFCVGYFHLRGWDSIADLVEGFAGSVDSWCRVPVGMQRPPQDAMRRLQSALRREQRLDGPSAARLRREMAKSFKEQIEFGLPSSAAETTLRRLAR